MDHYASSKNCAANRSNKASVWFVKDICGIICACLTWMLMLYAEFVVCFVILWPTTRLFYRYFNAVIFQTFTLFAFISHLRTMFTDPGAVPKGNAANDAFIPDGVRNGQLIFKCPKCCSFKPERAHHCSVCQRYVFTSTSIDVRVNRETKKELEVQQKDQNIFVSSNPIDCCGRPAFLIQLCM